MGFIASKGATSCPPHWADMGFRVASVGDRWLYRRGRIVIVSAEKLSDGEWVVRDATLSDLDSPKHSFSSEVEARLKAYEIVQGVAW